MAKLWLPAAARKRRGRDCKRGCELGRPSEWEAEATLLLLLCAHPIIHHHFRLLPEECHFRTNLFAEYCHCCWVEVSCIIVFAAAAAGLG